MKNNHFPGDFLNIFHLLHVSDMSQTVFLKDGFCHCSKFWLPMLYPGGRDKSFISTHVNIVEKQHTVGFYMCFDNT